MDCNEGEGRDMAKDIAQRDLDQAGHRISNLGDPTILGDATKVDTVSLPKVAAGSGAPGTSLLAAPADHVHPVGPGTAQGASAITFNDPSAQSADSGVDVVWAQAVDLSALPGDTIACSVAAIVRTTQGALGRVELRMGGDSHLPDGDLVAAFLTSSAVDELGSARAEIPKPGGPTIVKVTAVVASAPGEVIVSGKTISFETV
jgi:hypothetical protein